MSGDRFRKILINCLRLRSEHFADYYAPILGWLLDCTSGYSNVRSHKHVDFGRTHRPGKGSR